MTADNTIIAAIMTPIVFIFCNTELKPHNIICVLPIGYNPVAGKSVVAKLYRHLQMTFQFFAKTADFFSNRKYD